MRTKWFNFAIALILFHNSSEAQNIEWSLGLMGFADNREYKSSIQLPQTIFGTRFTPEIGLRADSIHFLGLGLNILKEFGSDKLVDQLEVQLYYQLTGELFDFTFGSFSKNEIFKHAPRALYYDSLLYYRPNIKGLLWTIKRRNFKQSVYLDWTSRQADDIRETFIMGGFGEYSNQYLFLRNHVYMYHVAGMGIPIPGDHVRDNGVAYLSLGINAGLLFHLDSLSVSIGGMQSYERTRHVEEWHTPKGILVEATIEHKGFGLSNVLYIGEGHNLDWGDPFYRLKQYNRLDLYYCMMRHKQVRSTFGISFHFAEAKVHNQQQFFIRVNFDSPKGRETERLNSFSR